MGLTPLARYREPGESREALPPLTEQDKAAHKAAAEMLKKLAHRVPVDPDTVAQTVVCSYVLERAAQAFKDPEILRALTSERPWDMVHLVDKTKAEEAVILGALPIIGDLVAEMDPSGSKPLFAYSRDEIIRLFEAVIWVWEEGKRDVRVAAANTPKKTSPVPSMADFPDDEIPF